VRAEGLLSSCGSLWKVDDAFLLMFLEGAAVLLEDGLGFFYQRRDCELV